MATRQNPRAGLEGLYYYYHTMAKTLSLYGEPIITDRRGVEHRWAKELGDHLVSLQKKDGFWQNKSDRWWEKIRALDTAYALVALAECQAQLAREKATAAPGLGGGDRAGGGDE
jgi:squalene-hopene/tetraprenyl-beta-curcumene cyclase